MGEERDALKIRTGFSLRKMPKVARGQIMSFHIPCHSKMRFEEAGKCVETVILPLNENPVRSSVFFFLFCIKSICLRKHYLFRINLRSLFCESQYL